MRELFPFSPLSEKDVSRPICHWLLWEAHQWWPVDPIVTVEKGWPIVSHYRGEWALSDGQREAKNRERWGKQKEMLESIFFSRRVWWMWTSTLKQTEGPSIWCLGPATKSSLSFFPCHNLETCRVQGLMGANMALRYCSETSFLSTSHLSSSSAVVCEICPWFQRGKHKLSST